MALIETDLSRALAKGEALDDADFDEYLDAPHREPSKVFWTPVAVARLAARWLEQSHVRAVIDVGSGVGKFCIVAALAAPHLRLVGIEQRAPLVDAARRLSARFDLRRRASFAHATAQNTQLARFQAMYLFNPFGEGALPVAARLDDSVDLSAERARRDVHVVERALDDMSVGAVLLTYHGFGGCVPDTFELVRNEPIETDALRMWTKRHARSRGAVWVEIGSDVVLCNRNLLEARPQRPIRLDVWPWDQLGRRQSRPDAVLILSQDAVWRHAAAAELCRRGVDVALESELAAACAAHPRNQPGLWIVDSRIDDFPRSRGCLRSVARARLVVVACASEHFEKMLEVAFQDGVTGLVPRSASPARLAGSVHALLEESRARRVRWF